MASTPKSIASESLTGSSWVEVGESPLRCISIPDNVSLEQIMKEVQNEFVQLSQHGGEHTPIECTSPIQQKSANDICSSKSSELLLDEAEIEHLRKQLTAENLKQLNSDWIWYWKNESADKRSSMSEKKLNMRQWAIRRGIFSKEVLSILLLTNVVSVALGVGIGYTALIRRIL